MRYGRHTWRGSTELPQICCKISECLLKAQRVLPAHGGAPCAAPAGRSGAGGALARLTAGAPFRGRSRCGSAGLAPSRDNLLVPYFDDRAQVQQVATRLATLGHLPVEAENPCWPENGAVTVEDPDHWRVVLMPQPLT